MLNLNDPRSSRVLAAARQIDFILGCCKQMTISGRSRARQAVLEIMRPGFAALRWLNQERYGRSAEIADTIARLEREAEALADRKVAHPPKGVIAKSHCPVCGETLTVPSEYDPIPYCSACIDGVPSLFRLRSFDAGFGTDAI